MIFRVVPSSSTTGLVGGRAPQLLQSMTHGHIVVGTASMVSVLRLSTIDPPRISAPATGCHCAARDSPHSKNRHVVAACGVWHVVVRRMRAAPGGYGRG